MKFYNTELKHNKRMIADSGKRTKLAKKMVTLALISFLVISASVALFSSAVFAEPSTTKLLADLGFTNVALTPIETFPPGLYEATLLAEFGEFYDINILSYYAVGSEDFQTIFSGPEGAPVGIGGYVSPTLSKTFEIEQSFGLSLFAPYRYYTETARNPDGEQHAQVYSNLNSSNMYVICFEDEYAGYDNDFNDMVLSLTKVSPPKIISVVRSILNPNDGEPVEVTAKVSKGSDDIGSVFLSYQVGSSGWFSEPMTLESGNYVAEIPGQIVGAQVKYQVYAYDIKGFSAVSSIYSYTTTTIFSGYLPIAQIEYSPSVAHTGEVVDFDGSTSYDLDGTIVSYSWDFGDGNNATGVTVAHAYEEDGEYPVSLTVVDNEDLVGSYVVSLVVKNRSPVADFTESATTVNKNEMVTLDASSSYDPDGTIVSYTWSFGDGKATTGEIVDHSYPDSGYYVVTLTVNDEDGATDDRKRAILVVEESNMAPVAILDATAAAVTIGGTVSFDASESYDTDGTIEAYSWDFGDGNTATGVTVDHTYDDEGRYIVTLTVTDDEGATGNDLSSVTVTEIGVDEPEPGDDEPEPVMNEPPVAIFSKTAETASIGENINFNASESYDTDGTIEAYSWDFGDGTTATGVTADHVYTETGTYPITLVVTDNDVAESSVVAEVTVTTETTISLAVLSAVGLGITGLTAILLIFFFQRRKKKKGFQSK